MRTVFLFVALSLAAAGCQRSSSATSAGAASSDAPATSAPNAYAAQAANIWFGRGTARSPDGQYAVQLDRSLADAAPDGRPAPLVNIIETGQSPMPINLVSVIGAEVLWAPDSSAVAISANNGGDDAGPYGVTLVRHLSGGWRQENLSPMIAQTYAAPNRCVSPEPTEAAAVAWLANDRLLLTAQTPSGTNCDNAGTFRTFEYDLTAGRIVAVHDQLESKRLYGPKLGAALMGANDGCITNPTSCQVAALHPQPDTLPAQP